jgi:hypothetical protein
MSGLRRGFAALALGVSFGASRVALAQAAPEDARAPSSATKSDRSSLEVTLKVAPSVVFGEPANPTYTQSTSRVGAAVSGSVTYRSSYFIDPVLEIGYAWLARGTSELPQGPWGEGGALDQELGTWFVSPGISTQLWRFRPRLGLGLAVITQSNTFRGEQTSTTQPSLLSQLAVAVRALELGSVGLDAEASLVHASGAEVTFISIGVAARLDVLSFGGP